MGFDCPVGAREGLCGGSQAEMLELEDAGSVLISSSTKVNVSKEACTSICLNDCNCVAALYSFKKGDTNMQVCSFYYLVNGVKQMNRGSRLSYLVKVPKREGGVHRKTSLRKWVMILVVVADGVVLFLVLADILHHLVYYAPLPHVEAFRGFPFVPVPPPPPVYIPFMTLELLV
ncbi:hypothetical protein Nepgr_016527 [Nepenthes gracilis]|uniref:PAN-3 domain-containing protein n=1 Tax=Nepenthes gracilis TaxID=150966 RepID=A0AAD3XSF0_NEPGR|nr:hypothetical protein Nepgr_016527 [Nepenthes gracilis]